MVYAIRAQRKESLLLRTAYAVFYRTLRAVAQIDVALDAGDFCLLDRRVVDALVALPEQHRFLRGLRSWVGFRQLGIECERDARHAGTSKYTFRKLVRLALSGYIGFSSGPLRLAALLGVATAAGGFAIALWVLVTKILDVASPRGWASLLACLMVVGGVQLLVLGIIGEYLGRGYDEVRRRPLFLVRDRVGLDELRRYGATGGVVDALRTGSGRIPLYGAYRSVPIHGQGWTAAFGGVIFRTAGGTHENRAYSVPRPRCRHARAVASSACGCPAGERRLPRVSPPG